MKNYRVLFYLKLLKSILMTFVDSFLVLYFIELSDSNILPFAIYKLVAITVIFATIFSLRNLAKSKYRSHILRIGIFLDLVYFVAILLLKERIVDYMYLMGVLYGLEEGCYYSVYNMFEADGVDDKRRANFLGMYTAIKSILAIVFPILIGSYILTSGFFRAVAVVIIIVLLRIALSFKFKDKNKPKATKTNFKEYAKIVSDKEDILQFYRFSIINGMTYSGAAFSSIVTIYIIRIFSDSFSLGIFTSIFSLVSCILGILFAKVLKPKHYAKSITISVVFTVSALFAMILKCNMVTVVVFNFVQTILRTICELVTENYQYILSNTKEIQTEYKVEFFNVNECALFIGRIISYALFILMAFVENSTPIVMLFGGIILIYAYSVIRLNTIVQNKKNVDESKKTSNTIIKEGVETQYQVNI